jgi:hypothetical protein
MQAVNQISTRGKVTVRGIVMPVDWDERERVTSVAVSSVDEQEYVVAESGALRKLLRHVNEVVEVTGVVTENEYGEKTITVERFEVSQDEEEEEDWEEDDEDWDDDEDDEDWDDDEDDDWDDDEEDWEDDEKDDE